VSGPAGTYNVAYSASGGSASISYGARGSCGG